MEPTGHPRATAPGWVVFLLAGLAGVALMSILPEPLRAGLFMVLAVAPALAAGWSARRWPHPGGPARPLFVGSVLLAAAYLLWYPATRHWDLVLRSPSVTDLLFLGAYSALLVALRRIIRFRGSADRRVQALDSLMVSIGLTVLGWVLFISPYLHDQTLSAPAKVTAVLYPLVDLLLVGSVVRLLVQGRVWSISDRLLAAWIAAQLAGDTVYTVTTLNGTFDFDNAAASFYALSFVVLGAAVLHPSFADLGERPPAPAPTGIRRLAFVGSATLISPAVLIVLGVQGKSEDVPAVALLSAVLFGLVLARVGLLMVDVREHHRIQAQLRERQVLSDRLFSIQRKISTRAPLQDVLDSITAGAAELLGDEVVALRLLDEEDPATMVMASSVGIEPHEVSALERLPVGLGLGGQALVEDHLCTRESYGSWDRAIPVFADSGLDSAMAAPVHLEGRPIGSLMVGTRRRGRTYSEADQRALAGFAEHVSLALNDARTVEAMNQALDRAVHQAMHDALTGLPNRACFYDRTDQALRRGRRDRCKTAVLLFDLDRFKEVNDTLGHRYGDRLLRAIGGRIGPLLRDSDTLARLGGDEFCVLLPEVVDEAAAFEVASMIIAALEEPFDIDGLRMAVEASCGIALAPVHGDSADLLLQRSDVAMYVAKRSHVDVVTYDDELDANTPDRLALLGDLRTAIAAEQLVLHYQPQVALHGDAVQGVEALVRWDHPRLGHLGPGRFIPVAEDSGLIKPLTSWVLGAGLDQLRRWLDDEPLGLSDDFAVSINLSTRSLLDDGFPDEVKRALDERGIPGHRLVLEVTETAIMADPERAQELLGELSAVGVRFAIDDFGTGYSSLAALKNLPVHHLKIDQSFVLDMHEDVNDATIVRSVIDLGHTLGLRAIAEGVESPEAWELLRELGCDAAQGFLLAAGMPATELRTWLMESKALCAGPLDRGP